MINTSQLVGPPMDSKEHTNAPVNHIPPEILDSILEYCLDMDTRTPFESTSLGPSLVCRRWRNCGLRYIWRYWSFKYTKSTSMRLNFLDESPHIRPLIRHVHMQSVTDSYINTLPSLLEKLPNLEELTCSTAPQEGQCEAKEAHSIPRVLPTKRFKLAKLTVEPQGRSTHLFNILANFSEVKHLRVLLCSYERPCDRISDAWNTRVESLQLVGSNWEGVLPAMYQLSTILAPDALRKLDLVETHNMNRPVINGFLRAFGSKLETLRFALRAFMPSEPLLVPTACPMLSTLHLHMGPPSRFKQITTSRWNECMELLKHAPAGLRDISLEISYCTFTSMEAQFDSYIKSFNWSVLERFLENSERRAVVQRFQLLFCDEGRLQVDRETMEDTVRELLSPRAFQMLAPIILYEEP